MSFSLGKFHWHRNELLKLRYVQSSHLAMCSAKICRMETVSLSTECSSFQQLLNETITGHRKTENTDDCGKKLYGAEKVRTEKDY